VPRVVVADADLLAAPEDDDGVGGYRGATEDRTGASMHRPGLAGFTRSSRLCRPSSPEGRSMRKLSLATIAMLALTLVTAAPVSAGSTKRVKDIRPGASGSYPEQLTSVGGTVFFTAYTKKKGRELWKSDGTRRGTKLVKDIVPGPRSTRYYDLVDVKGTLFFVSGDDATRKALCCGFELWKSDGTKAGTKMVKDIRPGKISSGSGFSHHCRRVGLLHGG
jgi:ELWxxDGT repeat protein